MTVIFCYNKQFFSICKLIIIKWANFFAIYLKRRNNTINNPKFILQFTKTQNEWVKSIVYFIFCFSLRLFRINSVSMNGGSIMYLRVIKLFCNFFVGTIIFCSNYFSSCCVNVSCCYWDCMSLILIVLRRIITLFC